MSETENVFSLDMSETLLIELCEMFLLAMISFFPTLKVPPVTQLIFV